MLKWSNKKVVDKELNFCPVTMRSLEPILNLLPLFFACRVVVARRVMETHFKFMNTYVLYRCLENNSMPRHDVGIVGEEVKVKRDV